MRYCVRFDWDGNVYLIGADQAELFDALVVDVDSFKKSPMFANDCLGDAGGLDRLTFENPLLDEKPEPGA